MTTINSWFRDQAEYQEHLDIIRNPLLWPKGDVVVLHLKNPERMEKDEPRQFGILYTNRGWLVHGFGSEAWTESYRSAEELMEAGWVVD